MSASTLSATPDDTSASLFERRLQRERQARKHAEALLEDKSRDLFSANQSLRELAQSLEAQVALRTEELTRARDEALAANRAKTEFLATMSHEIRTPLNGVLGMLELLLGSGLRDEQAEMARIALNSAELLLRIINDILDLSKIEAGKLELEHIPFDPSELVRSTTRGLEGLASDKGLRLTLDIDASLPSRLLGDPTRLQQVLTNLIGNAIKFTEQGGIEIRLTAADGSLRIEVEDSGIGIPEDRLHELFHPFTQMDSSHTRRFGGTGLGLAICRRLAEGMGGRIGARSASGRGSLFWVELPMRAAATPPPPPENEPSAHVLTHRHVLLVEDNPVNQMVARKLLERMGLSVRVASSGEEALALTGEERFDAVLMDCQMPGLDGLETTRRLRAQGIESPIIALTANATEGDRQACLACGMDDFLSKPFRADDLGITLSRWVTGPAKTTT
ncbi:MAG: ATP-binding protein [Pseudomonadota bacterium]